MVTTVLARSGLRRWGESKGAGSLTSGPGPFYTFLNKFQIPLKVEIQNRSLPLFKKYPHFA
jgi:hypothetical protein